MIAWVDAFSFDTPAERRVAGDALSELVTESVERSSSVASSPRPSSMGRLMVALASPEPASASTTLFWNRDPLGAGGVGSLGARASHCSRDWARLKSPILRRREEL